MRTTLAAAIAAAFALSSGPALAHADINDAAIAHIVVTANQVDIDAGHLAETKASRTDVRDFAKQMVTDHSGVNGQAVALVKKLGVTPEDNATSRALKAEGDDNLRSLRTLDGAKFDRAYVDHEVAYHEQVLDAIDRTLVPDAHNAELKALLVKVRPAFVGHLEHARHIQSALTKGQ